MRINIRRSGPVVSACVVLLGQPALSQREPVSAPISGVRYEITATSASLKARKLSVSTSFDVADTATVILALPAWTPGAYELSYFARWVSGFSATESGSPLRWDKLDYDTWRIHPAHAGRVTVSFDYTADTLDNAMAWSRSDFALFNGTNVFHYPAGRSLDFPATVVIHADTGWRIATSMPSAGTPRTWRATNYNDLVDMPVFVGRFDMDSATVAGRTLRYATYPVGSVSGASRSEAWDQLKRIIPVESNVFGETPWDSYSLLQIMDSSAQGYAGLEHSSSHVDIVAPQFIGSESQPSLYAHEIFHAWNVKRLRPADLVPYRYDRSQPTPWLWVSEGVTDYYADLTQVRAGIIDASGFYALTAGKIGEITATVPFALEDASVNTWIHPKDGTEYSYYPKGSLAGFMLDLIIRDASDNRHSLDGVMRDLYQGTWKKGHGFTRADFWSTVSRAANGKSFEDFERNYVDGREPYPWPSMLSLAGLELVPDSTPRIGVTTGNDPAGAVRVITIDTTSAAAQAGVQPGDELVSVGEIPVADASFGAKFRVRYAGRPSGSPLPIVVKRGTQTLTLQSSLKYSSITPRIVEDAGASPKARRIREGLLRGTITR